MENIKWLKEMGKVTGFLEFERNDRHYAPVEERVRHYREFVLGWRRRFALRQGFT